MDDSSTGNPTAPNDVAAAAPDDVDALRAQLEDKQDRLLRALAETDNVRRRAQRERDDYVKYANESLLRDFVPILDNLDRALAAARSGGDPGAVVSGVELI